MNTQEKAKVNRFLGSAGLGQLSDPGLMKQVGFLAGQKIKGHDDLRRWLNACDVDKRGDMMEALKPYLKFTPKPLDVYESEMGMEAEANQLPVWEDGKFRSFNPTEINGQPEPNRTDRLIGLTPIAERLQADRLLYHEFGIIPGEPPAKQEVPKTDEQRASEVIAKEYGRQKIWVVCGQCTKEEVFEGWDKKAAMEKLRWWGWKLNPATDQELCEKCAKTSGF